MAFRLLTLLGSNQTHAGLFYYIMNAQSGINQMVAITYVLLLVVGVGGSAYVAWCFSRSRLLLRRWAKKNGFEILHSTVIPFSKGIFDPYRRDLQMVYHVRIRDREGREHTGWVRCGGFWKTMAEAKWEPAS
jgi:hypothetical protein